MSMTATKTESAVSSELGVRPKASGRLMSLDALRGFDMIWILGAGGIVVQLAKLSDSAILKELGNQMQHKPWDGFAFEDLIFPMFVFIAGVSLVFSLTKQIETRGRSAAIRRIISRAIPLFLLGIFYSGGLSKGFEEVRLLGVLQRIALASLFAGLAFCFLRTRGLLLLTVGLLVGYWALLTYVPAPGLQSPSFAEGKNLTNYLDAQYLPGRKYNGDHDPEGLLSTFPAIASCLLGVLAGLLLKNEKIRPAVKVASLLVAGAVGVGLGFAWGLQFPVIKKIWTSSFVLVAGGYSAILLGLFYLVLDVWQWRRWASPFVWIGTNAILLYMLGNIVFFRGLAERLIGGGGDVQKAVFGPFQPLALSIVAVLLVLAIARFFHTRQIFLRV
jgi:predicted acyltransferase